MTVFGMAMEEVKAFEQDGPGNEANKGATKKRGRTESDAKGFYYDFTPLEEAGNIS